MIHWGRSYGERPQPLPVLTATLAGLALCLASCTARTGVSPVAADSPAATTAPGNACASPSTRYDESCQAVTVSGKTFRYLFFRTTPATPDTMIFDGGGPGMSNLSRIDARYEQVVADAHARGLNLLILDEPWVVAPYEPACHSAMASFYRESVQRYPQPATSSAAASVRRNCLSADAAATTTAEAYRAIVSHIEQVEKAKVVRLEGYSFASVRAAYLGAVRPNLIVAVSTPFPVGAQAADFYTAIGVTAANVQRIVPDGGLTADSAVAYYATTGTPPKALDQTTAARALWQVNNAGDISLSRVGYYSEICAALTDWTALIGQTRQNGSALTALASVHAPCAAGDQPATLRLPPKTYFAVLASDQNSPWVPSPLTRDAHILAVATGEHGNVEIPACQ